MKIINVTTVLLTGPCTNDPFLSEARKLRSAAFIKIETDAGITGIGETYAGYFIPEAVPSIVEFFKPILLGCNVEDIPALWARMYHCGNFWCRVGLGTIVLCGIEAALWDIKGKASGRPVWKLLQERWSPQFGDAVGSHLLPCYATGGPSNYPLDKLEAKVEFYMSLGFKGIKIGAGAFYKNEGFLIPDDPEKAADLEAEKLSFLRAKFGSELSLMLDAHMGNSISTVWALTLPFPLQKRLNLLIFCFWKKRCTTQNRIGIINCRRIRQCQLQVGNV